MLFLSRYKNVISIDDLITGKNIKQENIVITFDDGFKNNIKAAEILNNLNLPATFYLCIGNILDNKMFDNLHVFFLFRKVQFCHFYEDVIMFCYIIFIWII